MIYALCLLICAILASLLICAILASMGASGPLFTVSWWRGFGWAMFFFVVGAAARNLWPA